jgi:hypothetical protein
LEDLCIHNGKVTGVVVNRTVISEPLRIDPVVPNAGVVWFVRFFGEGLARFGIEVLVPEPEDQDRTNQVICQEFCRGQIRTGSRRLHLEIIERLRGKGAQGIVLGCTEIPLQARPQDCALRLLNPTLLHAAKALDFAVQPRSDARSVKKLAQ